MYAKYVSTANAVLANVIADIAALFTGASIASLSASCDKVNTTLVSTVAPGWTLVDSAAPSGVVISSPDAGGLTTKYARLYSFNATGIDIMGYEGWNAATHAGTNPTTANGTLAGFSATAVNIYWIFATPRSIFISNPAAVSGGGLFEFTRDCAYLQGSTYPCFMVTSSSNITNPSSSAYAYLPRIKNLGAAGDTTSASVLIGTIAARYGNASQGAISGTYYDGSGNPYYEMRPMWLVSAIVNGGILGRIYDAVELARAAGSPYDTFSDGTDTWMIQPSSTYSMVLKAS